MKLLRLRPECQTYRNAEKTGHVCRQTETHRHRHAQTDGHRQTSMHYDRYLRDHTAGDADHLQVVDLACQIRNFGILQVEQLPCMESEVVNLVGNTG